MSNFNAIPALDSCALNATWLERHQPWELGDAAKYFMNNAATFERHNSTPSAMDSWKLAATKVLEHDSSATFKEPTSVLDLQSSSLSSQHSFNSVSDGTSAALQTVTDQLLSDSEQDSAFLTKTTAKPNVDMDHSILTWMELMRESEEDPIAQCTRDQHQSCNSCADMDLDFDLRTMESIATTPSSHHGSLEQQLLRDSAIPESSARHQILSHNSLTLASQSRPGYQQNDMNYKPQGTTTLPSMFDSVTAIPASQLQNYTVVPTAELRWLLSSQNHNPDGSSSRVCTNFVNDDGADRQSVGGQVTPSSNFRSGVPQDQENGLHLVHLLLACAEAIDLCESTIAAPMLARLRSISSLQGDPMQRIALYFAAALSERLANEMATPQSPPASSTPTTLDTLECDIAYQAYYQILPFQKFTHFTANQALLEAVRDYPCVHIVDFNICQGLQWPSFMQSLALLPKDPPRLRITAVQTDAAAALVTGNRLSEFARSLQVPFEFQIIEENLETFHRGMISPRADEALAVNCSDILHKLLRKEGKLHSLLCKIRSLRPVVVTVLEADANHNVPSFMSRFVQALHYYCALFDSLETTLERTSMDRLRIESLRFGAEIRSIVAMEGVDREVRHVRAEAWQSLFRKAGFQEVPMSRYAADQAQLLLSLYETSDTMPFTLSSEFGGLSLGWQQTPVMVVSSWTC